MSIIKSIKQVLGLGPAAESHHWDGSVPNQLSLKRGTPEAPGAELIKALDGILSFPNQGQSLTGNGYVKLPGGLIIQWGYDAISAGGGVVVTLPIPFPTAPLAAVATARTIGGGSEATVKTVDFTTTTLNINGYVNGVLGATSVQWIAIGY